MVGENFLMFSTVVVKKLYLIYSSVGDIKFSFPSFNEVEIIFIIILIKSLPTHERFLNASP